MQPVSQAGARHQDRAVVDLAQVADGGADNCGAVAEDRTLTHPDRMLDRADHHPVLKDGRVVPEAHRSSVRPHDQALRQDGASTDVYVTEEHSRTGNPGFRLIFEQTNAMAGGMPTFGPLPNHRLADQEGQYQSHRSIPQARAGRRASLDRVAHAAGRIQLTVGKGPRSRIYVDVWRSERLVTKLCRPPQHRGC